MKIISVDLPWKEETRKRRTLAIADLNGKIEIERASDDKEILALVSKNAEPKSIILLDVPIEGYEELIQRSEHFRPVDKALLKSGISILPSSKAEDRGKRLKKKIQSQCRKQGKEVTVQEIYPYAVYKFLAYLKNNKALKTLKGNRFDTLLKDGFVTYWPPKYKREKEKGKHLKKMKDLYSLLMDTLFALDFQISLQSPKPSSNLGQLSDDYDACLGVIVGIYFAEKSSYACVAGDSSSGNILLLADRWLSERLGKEVRVY